jgi:sugar lactone lactonase YvrE
MVRRQKSSKRFGVASKRGALLCYLASCLLASCGLVENAPLPGYTVQTIAGTETGFRDGPADQAAFSGPSGLALIGNALYIADSANGPVRALDLKKASVSTLPGPTTVSQRFVKLFGIVTLRTEPPETLAVADLGSPQLWQLARHGGSWQPATVAGLADQWNSVDGPLSKATFSSIAGLAADKTNQRLFVSDETSIRVVTPTDVSTLVTRPAIVRPTWLAFDASKQLLYVVESGHDRIVSVPASGGDVELVAGTGERGFADGPAISAMFDEPGQIHVWGGAVFVADTANHRIRRIENGRVTTVAGDGTDGIADGSADVARFSGPIGLTGDAAGRLYVSDQFSGRIRRLDLIEAAHY